MNKDEYIKPLNERIHSFFSNQEQRRLDKTPLYADITIHHVPHNLCEPSFCTIQDDREDEDSIEL